jgi:hypothetical protein
MSDSPPKPARDFIIRRMVAGVFCAAILADLAYLAIWRHELHGRWSSSMVSPTVGIIIGGIEITSALYLLFAWTWGGYRALKLERKVVPDDLKRSG